MTSLLRNAAAIPCICWLNSSGLTLQEQSTAITMATSTSGRVLSASGGLDLSLGSVMGLSGVVGAYVAVTIGAPSMFGVLACILTGALAGYINGQIVTRAFVVIAVLRAW